MKKTRKSIKKSNHAQHELLKLVEEPKCTECEALEKKYKNKQERTIITAVLATFAVTMSLVIFLLNNQEKRENIAWAYYSLTGQSEKAEAIIVKHREERTPVRFRKATQND